MDIQNVLAKAQRMMLDENFNRDVERAAAAMPGKKSKKNSENQFSGMEDALFGVDSTPSYGYEKGNIPESAKYDKIDTTGVVMLNERPEKNTTNSKIPKEILESFAKTPSPIEDLNGYNSDSLAQALFLPSEERQSAAPKQPIREAAPQRPIQQNSMAGGGIDYNALKFIISECVKEAMKSNLNEGVVRGMKIGDGNVIQFLDSRGNLYEGQLKLKKKAKK